MSSSEYPKRDETEPEPITWIDPEEEEADWEPPSLADPSSLPDNTSEWKFFYRRKGLAPRRAWPLAISFTREITAPWRRGPGLSVSSSGTRTTFGIWWVGDPPQYLQEPKAVKLRKTLRRARRYDRKYPTRS